MRRTILSELINSKRAMALPSMSACDSMALSGSGAGLSSRDVN